MMLWEKLHPEFKPEMLGFLPSFLSEDDPDPAREQIDKHYAHGGGWRSMTGFKVSPSKALLYPGDPALQPLAQTKLRDELIVFYDCEIVAIFQPDGSFDAARIN
jgi:hypothetical protein